MVLAAILVFGVIAVLLFNRKPKDESSQPTPPGGTASRPSHPRPEPATRTLPPITAILPDRTAAAIVIRPEVLWKRVAYEPGAGRRLGAHADALATRVRFDPHKFDRLTIAFVGRESSTVAIGEGAYLTPEWVAGLESTWKAKLDLANGIKAFRFNPLGPAPHYSMILGTTGYAVANNRKTLEGLSTQADQLRPPQGVSETILSALADVSSPTAPLVTFAAGPTWTLPDETTLDSHGLRSIKGTVTLKDNVFSYDIVLSGPAKSRLTEFWNEYLGTKLPEQFPALRSFANALATVKQSERVTGTAMELHLTGEIDWTAFHDALDRVLPVPENDAK